MNYLLQRATVILMLLLFSTTVMAFNFPPLTDRVIDQANLLSLQTKANLIATLKANEDKTTDQVAIVTINSLEGRSIEEYGVELGRQWGIGQKTKNNGVILLVAPHEHQVRIEVGYGLEGTLTDGLCSIIIERRIVPAFKHGDFENGIKAEVDGVISILNRDIPKDLQKSPAKNKFSELVMPMLYFAFFLSFLIAPYVSRGQTFVPALFSGAIGGAVSWIVTTSLLVGITVGAFLFLLIYLGGGIGTWPSYNGGSSSGGFSGGGGSFGGGGASGRW